MQVRVNSQMIDFQRILEENSNFSGRVPLYNGTLKRLIDNRIGFGMKDEPSFNLTLRHC